MTVPPQTHGHVVARLGPVRGVSVGGYTTRTAWIYALAFGAAGLAWRIALLLSDVPPSNSDEATAGLAAMHIAEGRNFPIFFYGQPYLGAIQSYFAAPLFAVFEPSTVLLRVPPLMAYVLFVFLMYRLTVSILGPWHAVATVGVLALGSDRVVKNQLIGAGGYPELAPMIVALFLIAVAVATNTVKRENLAFAAWGLICGVALWTHWLAAPYLVAAAVMLLAGCRRRLMGVGGLALVAAMVAGAGPLLWHNLTAPRDLNSISVFLEVSSNGGDPSLLARLFGGAVVGIPLATGLCGPGECDPTRLWWTPVYVFLICLGGVWAAAAVRTAAAGSDRVRPLAVLMLAASALVTIALYVRSPAAGETPTESARYLHFVLVSTPVWIWALWRLAAGVWGWLGRLPAVLTAGTVALAMVVATVELGTQVPSYRGWAAENRALVAELEARSVRQVYGGYWTCHLIVFATAEGITCASLSPSLGKGVNRYPPYWDQVRASSQPPVFVTRVEPGPTEPRPQLDAAVRRLLNDSGVPFDVTRIGGYVIYQPSGPVALP